MKRRVVITGMEIVSSIGNGVQNFWQAAVEGTCGIDRIQAYDPSPYPTQIGGEVREFSGANVPNLEKSRRLARVAQYAIYCSHYAILDSGLNGQDLLNAGTFIGTSLGGVPELEGAYKVFFQESWKKIPALSVLRGMPNSVANYVAINFGLGGPNSTISNACVSSAEAIGYAYQQIAYGRLNVALCGGVESLLWETMMAAWCKLRVMSVDNDNPKGACRPFDATRNGLVMADGAGILVLEEYQQAKARGAKIYAEVLGFGASCDAHHVTAPSVAGQVRAISAALDDAKISPYDIHYINAHGTGTQLNDLTETATFKTIFGEYAYNIPITAQKAMTGHTIGAAGAMEIIATSLSLQHGVLLPTINLTNPDPQCDLDYIPQVARTKSIDLALSTHFAFGGANAALVLCRV